MTTVQVRRFNKEGIIRFENMLIEFRNSKIINQSSLNEILQDYLLSDILDGNKQLVIDDSLNKYKISKSISDSLNLDNSPDLYYDKGLWTWLSAVMLNKLVHFNTKTREAEFKEKALYVLEPESWNRYYRHLLAFPSWIYSTLKEKGRIFLRGEIYERGEIVEQLASVRDIQRNPSIVEAATILYYSPVNDNIHKGAASQNKGGTSRRFREVIRQFQMTYDLNAMDGEQIVDLLPKEFEGWKKLHSTSATAVAI